MASGQKRVKSTASRLENKGVQADPTERLEGPDEPTPAVGLVLRRAREHRGLSLREVERRTGRPNAYLSQVERGLIRRPDPLLLLELADLYGLDFPTLAEWVGLAFSERPSGVDPGNESLRSILRLALQLSPGQRAQVLAHAEELIRQSQT